MTTEGPSGRGAAPSTPVLRGDGGSTQPELLTGRRDRRYRPEWKARSDHHPSGWLIDAYWPFRAEWERRFRRPPTDRQWACIAGHYKANPERVVALLREAPTDLQSNEVFGYLFERLPRREGRG